MKLKINQQQIYNAIVRFPITLLSSLGATVFALIKIQNSEIGNDPYFFTCLLGVSVAFGVEIGSEQRRITKWKQALVITFVLGLFYFFVVKEASQLFQNEQVTIRTIIALLIAHLFVSFSPFLNSNEGFWSYNKHLFLTILTSFLYTVTLSIGLLLAIQGVGSLFDIQISSKTYPSMWVILNGFLNTVIFTSKFPKLDELDHSYPKGLKYFTLYVLLPLVSVYLLILFAYEIKIISSWQLPVGWVSMMVLASAVLGIFAFLLLFPIKSQNTWVARFSRIYYRLLIPLIALLFVAIYTRVNQYGLTESRFFVVVLAFWLLGITLYFLFRDNIKIIPISLSIVAFFAAFGPFSAFNVSLKNQTKRFNEVLNSNNLLVNKKISYSGKKTISDKDADKLHAAVEYLASNSPQTLTSVVKGKIDPKNAQFSIVSDFYKRTGLPKQVNKQIYDYQGFGVKSTEQMHIGGYDLMSRFSYYKNSENQTIGSNKVKFNVADYKCRIVFDGSETLDINLENLKSFHTYDLNPDSLSFIGESKNWKVKLLIESGTLRDGKVDNLYGWIMTKKKD